MTPKKTHHSLVTGKEIKAYFPNSNLDLIEFDDISQNINHLLSDACLKLDQEARKHKYQKNLKLIKKHLNKASEYMQIIPTPKGQETICLPTNETKDIGLTFDDWINVEGIINRLEEAQKITIDKDGKTASYKAHKQSIFSELFYYIHSLLTGIDGINKLAWSGGSEFTKFEKIIHFLLKKININVVSDKKIKKNEEDIPEETIRYYIKQAKAVHNKHQKGS